MSRHLAGHPAPAPQVLVRLSEGSPNRRARALALRRAHGVDRSPAPRRAPRREGIDRAIDWFEVVGTSVVIVAAAALVLRFVLAWGRGLLG